ncbi:hypothetical protein HYX00_04295 [Candidatus Woesearchaeota archaeon]|nr:hypothetical protein [Candidatus Woesearchaeota archaeon]
MKIFDLKNGYIAHPGMLFIVGLIIGIVLTVLWAQQIISVPFPFCK